MAGRAAGRDAGQPARNGGAHPGGRRRAAQAQSLHLPRKPSEVRAALHFRALQTENAPGPEPAAQKEPGFTKSRDVQVRWVSPVGGAASHAARGGAGRWAEAAPGTRRPPVATTDPARRGRVATAGCSWTGPGGEGSTDLGGAGGDPGRGAHVSPGLRASFGAKGTPPPPSLAPTARGRPGEGLSGRPCPEPPARLPRGAEPRRPPAPQPEHLSGGGGGSRARASRGSA
uniref:Uncharacterized protein n=1 Tax=Rangifer tarandus platyrhynchus TaxID=3082113 RepID=A0ACB0EW24_RANTA|nr:unnamed protein product [Rangifer tarandus platyrhynchus]